MKKIIPLFFSIILLNACSETSDGYKFSGEGEHWEAEYTYSRIDMVDSYEFKLKYKGSIVELSSLQKIEYTFETLNKKVYESEEFMEPPSTLTFSGSSKGGAKVFKDEVIYVTVLWDNFEESFVLRNE